jgi:hypothetical protein
MPDHPFAKWLRFLGISQREISVACGQYGTAAGVALYRNRPPSWLDTAAAITSVPSDILWAVPPLTPAARPYRARALGRVALWRMRTASARSPGAAGDRVAPAGR